MLPAGAPDWQRCKRAAAWTGPKTSAPRKTVTRAGVPARREELFSAIVR